MAALGGCTDEADLVQTRSGFSTVSGESSGSPYLINTAVRREAEDPFLELATKFEPFAGYYCRGGDLIVGYAGDVNSITAKLVELAVHESGVSYYCRDIDLPAHDPVVVLEQQKYNFLTLRAWRDDLTEVLFELPNVTRLSINYERNALSVGAKNVAFPEVEALAGGRGVPADGLILIEVQSPKLKHRCDWPSGPGTPPRPASWPAPPTPAPTSGTTLGLCFDPAVGGTQIWANEPLTGVDTGPCSITVAANRLNPVTSVYERELCL